MTQEWVDPLVRGGAALVATVVLFGVAWLHFARNGDEGAPTDVGLD